MSGNFWLSFFTLYSLYVPKDWISTFSTNGNERYYRSMCISYKINSVTPGKKRKDKQVSNVWLMLMFCDWISAFFVCVCFRYFSDVCVHITHTRACHFSEVKLLWIMRALVHDDPGCSHTLPLWSSLVAGLKPPKSILTVFRSHTLWLQPQTLSGSVSSTLNAGSRTSQLSRKLTSLGSLVNKSLKLSPL